MKVLFCGDSPNVSTGFARCTRAACDELYRVGHEVHILGINEFGDPSGYHSPVYPCYQPWDGGRDGFGVTRLPVLVNRIKPDVVVILNDAWNVKAYLEAMSERCNLSPLPVVIGWIAVDGKNQPGNDLNGLDHVSVWTDFAGRELQSGGYRGDYSVVPLGVDAHFSPRNRQEAREIACPIPGLADDTYIVGVVGRNQPRKRLDLTIAYFAEWIQRYSIDNARLYLHVAPTGDRGFDLGRLISYHAINGKVILSNPSIGHGVDGKLLPHIYSSFDVYLTTTQGEGWGLPCLEAMACGVPCIVPDWSGLGDWTGDAAEKVPCTSTAVSAPLNSLAYTIGGVMDKERCIQSLHDLYQSESLRNMYRQRGLDLAAKLTWHRTGREFRNVIESVVGSAARTVSNPEREDAA